MSNKSIFIVTIIFCMVGCDPSYPVLLQNNSEHTLNHAWKFSYPDTTISFVKKGLGGNTKPGNTGYIDFFGEPIDVKMKNNRIDTISFFIFDSEVVINYPWEEIQKDYKILQRYDLSLEDLKILDYELTYPPSIQMRYMKMYPPFEE